MRKLKVNERHIIWDALREKAKVIRHEAHECAKAVGKWNDIDVQRLVTEANAIDKLADEFRVI